MVQRPFSGPPIDDGQPTVTVGHITTDEERHEHIVQAARRNLRHTLFPIVRVLVGQLRDVNEAINIIKEVLEEIEGKYSEAEAHDEG